MLYYTYILYSKSLDRYYIGCCDNMDTRLKDHNTGRNTSTKTGIPWELIKSEGFNSRSEARKREAFIKKMKSREFIEKVIRGER